MSVFSKILGTASAQREMSPLPSVCEGWVLPGSWDAAEGICQVQIGDTLGFENAFFADGNLPLAPICRMVNPAIGDQYAPVGGERAMIWETSGGWLCWVYHGPDDSSPVPSGERWIQHRKVGSPPEGPEWDGSLKLTNDGPTPGDGLGGTYSGGTGALTQSQTGSGARHTIDDTAQTIETATAGGMLGTFDDIAKTITHAANPGVVYTIVDATGRAISHVVPNDGLVGLGALAAELDASNAAINKSILDTFGTNINSANLQTLINLAHAMVSAGIPNASSLIPLIVASLIQNVDVPDGSTIVRLVS